LAVQERTSSSPECTPRFTSSTTRGVIGRTPSGTFWNLRRRDRTAKAVGSAAPVLQDRAGIAVRLALPAAAVELAVDQHARAALVPVAPFDLRDVAQDRRALEPVVEVERPALARRTDRAEIAREPLPTSRDAALELRPGLRPAERLPADREHGDARRRHRRIGVVVQPAQRVDEPAVRVLQLGRALREARPHRTLDRGAHRVGRAQTERGVLRVAQVPSAAFVAVAEAVAVSVAQQLARGERGEPIAVGEILVRLHHEQPQRQVVRVELALVRIEEARHRGRDARFSCLNAVVQRREQEQRQFAGAHRRRRRRAYVLKQCRAHLVERTHDAFAQVVRLGRRGRGQSARARQRRRPRRSDPGTGTRPRQCRRGERVRGAAVRSAGAERGSRPRTPPLHRCRAASTRYPVRPPDPRRPSPPLRAGATPERHRHCTGDPTEP
jgi:hypothetical protein